MRAWHWDGFFDYLLNRYLLEGAAITVALTAASLLLGLALGVLLAVMRLFGGRVLAGAAGFYTWLFRGTPLLAQLLIIYTGLPLIGLKLGVVQAAVIGLSLNEAAYLTEIVRAGILAVSDGQAEAAAALGLRRAQVFRLVVWPQALRVIVPPLGNSVNGLLKTTSLTSVISMEELLRRAQILIQERFLVLELLAVASLYFLAMTTAWSLVQAAIERRMGRHRAVEIEADRR